MIEEKKDFNKKSKIRIIIIFSVLLAFISHISLHITSDFRLSLAAVFLGVLLLLRNELEPIILGITSGVFIAFFRIGLGSFNIESTIKLFEMNLPVITFYFSYGLLFKILINKNELRLKAKSLEKLIVPIIIIDFTANFFELSFRNFMNLSEINIDLLAIILLTAFIRGLLVILIYQVFLYYKYRLDQETREQEFKQLILRLSELKGEKYLLNKNELIIEEIMNDAYSLYKELSESNSNKEFIDKALKISKNVHEVKKDYLSTIKGLNEMTIEASDYRTLSIYEVFEILKTYLVEKNIEYELKLDYKIRSKLTDKHYELVSIFRNLINNSKEALKDIENPKLIISMDKKDGYYIIKVSDNGSGIKEYNLNHIFKPRFSTKYDRETGDVNRGIGLTLVKDIVDNELYGEIEVDSELGDGCTFIIKCLAKEIEVRN